MKFDIVANIIVGIFETGTECKKLLEIPKNTLLFYELQLEFQNWENSGLVSRLADQLHNQIKEINTSIDLINCNIILLNPDLLGLKVRKIIMTRPLLQKSLQNILKKIDISKGKSDEIMPHVNNSVFLFIKHLTEPVMDDTKNIVSKISGLKTSFFENVVVPKDYRKNVEEVIDLYIIGYRNTAMLVLGKIFESVLTRYLLILINNKIIKDKTKNDVMNMTFDNRLNYLSSKGYVLHKDWLVLSKLIWDRNIGGHSLKNNIETKETYSEAESTIKLALKLLSKYDDKL